MRIAREVALYNQGGIQNGIDGAEDRASKVATSFITRVSESEGIKVHNADDLTDYIQINSNGVDLVNDNVSIANFGESARVGKNGASRFMINADSLEAYDDNNSKYFEVSADGITFGSDAVASTDYADGKASAAQSAAISTAAADATSKANAAQSAAAADATSKANEAAKTATNYMYYSSSSGLNIASSNPSTATRKVQITSSAVKVQNDADNHADVTSSGLEVFKGGTSVANFGASARLGSASAEHLYVGSDGLLFSTGNTTNLGTVVDSTGTIIFTPNDIAVWPKSGTLSGGAINVLGTVKSHGVLLRILKLYDYIGTSSQYALPITITNSDITANMEVIHSVLSNPSAQAGDWTVTTSNGSLTISGSQSLQAGPTYITLYLAEPST